MASKPKQSSERGRHAADEAPQRGAAHRAGNGTPPRNRPSSASRAEHHEDSEYPPPAPARKSRPESMPPSSGDPLSAKDSKKGALEKLVEAGKNKGFLTYDEVNDALPADIAPDQLDDVVGALGDE